tara:strand:+ start:327 stop:575 length:249 start_codon:yes stop_codon:yes gene_type:complete
MEIVSNGINFTVDDESSVFTSDKKFVIDDGGELFYLFYNASTEYWHLDNCDGDSVESVHGNNFELDINAVEWACGLISNGDL